MSKNTALAVTVLLVTAATGWVAADSGTHAFGLTGPGISKLGWSSRSLHACDLDGDGRTDLVAINNDHARIDLLYQRRPGTAAEPEKRPAGDRWEPLLEDAPFDKRSVTTGIKMLALTAGDLDGDGRTDLAYTGNPDQLTVRYQSADGDFSQRRVLEIGEPVPYISSLAVGDLDGDLRQDLAVITKKGLLVFTQNEAGQLEGPRSYALTSDSCDALQPLDADGDGRTDLSYQIAHDPDRLRIRFAVAGGGFGPEHSFRAEIAGGALLPITLDHSTSPAFVRVQRDTGIVEVIRLEAVARTESLVKHVRPRVFSAEVAGTGSAVYAIGDLDGNGLPDIAVADPRGASMRLLLQAERGAFGEAEDFPSLTDVRSLAAVDLDGDGRSELIMASPKERAVAVASLTPAGRLSYPTPLPTDNKPWAVVAAHLDADDYPEIVFVYEEKKERGVGILRRGAPDEQWQQEIIPLADLKTGPRGLKVFDANHDGLMDLTVFASHEPVRFLLQDSTGAFAETEIGNGFRKGLVNDVPPSAFTTGDVDGDGRDEMLVAGTGYARALTIDDNGTVLVVDQFNTRAADTEVGAVMVADLDEDSVAEVVLVHEGGRTIEVLTRRANGVFEHAESAAIGAIGLVETRVVDLDGNHRPDLLLFGEDRFFWLPVRSEDLQLVTDSTYETDIKGVTHRLLGTGDLNSDGRQDIIAVDTRDSRVLEVLTMNPSGEWRSAMHFTVFEVDPHYAGQRGTTSEPSEIVVADLDNDAKQDLALLTHDRVLVYFQD